MDIQDKTKEELISELKELLYESDSLKALKEKREAELIIANKELAFQKKIFTYLSADNIDNYYFCFYK